MQGLLILIHTDIVVCARQKIKHRFEILSFEDLIYFISFKLLFQVGYEVMYMKFFIRALARRFNVKHLIYLLRSLGINFRNAIS